MLYSILTRSAWAVLLIIAGGAGVGAAELIFEIKIEHGRIPEAMRLVRVHQGDIVTLRWTSDRSVILHLHGYDIEKRIAAEATTELAFIAYATGRFPIEIHTQGVGATVHEDLPLATIEVYPR